jgi:hypothetical protein
MKDAEYAASNTSDVIYVVKFKIRRDVFLYYSGRPATHKYIRLYNTVKCTVPDFGREDQLYVF